MCSLTLCKLKAIGLLMNNASVTVQTGAIDKDSFSHYSRTCAMHCVQDMEWYEIPSAISEISVVSCQGKG